MSRHSDKIPKVGIIYRPISIGLFMPKSLEIIKYCVKVVIDLAALEMVRVMNMVLTSESFLFCKSNFLLTQEIKIDNIFCRNLVRLLQFWIISTILRREDWIERNQAFCMSSDCHNIGMLIEIINMKNKVSFRD